VTHYSSVTLTSDAAFTIGKGANASTNLTALGFSTGSFGGSTSGTKISDLTIGSVDEATQAIAAIDNALVTVTAARGELGAMENRLGYTVNNLTSMVGNTEASRSRIQDADYAKETTELARTQIVSQAATAMLAQANQVKQTVLSLLQ
jgi:flagellin